MKLLQKEEVEKIKKELLLDTEKKIKLFEATTHNFFNEDLGRIKLYDDRVRIKTHFEIVDNNEEIFLSQRPSYALVGKIIEISNIDKNLYEVEDSEKKEQNPKYPVASLTWKEQDNIKYSIIDEIHPEIKWGENKPPKLRLTEEGKIKKRPSEIF